MKPNNSRSIDNVTNPYSHFEQDINIAQVVRPLWAGKLWIIAFTFAACVIGMYYAFAIAVPKYTSVAVVALESRHEQVLDLESVMSGLSADQATINTEVEVLKSRGLIEKLVLAMNLKDDPEFNEALRKQSPYSPSAIIRSFKALIGVSTGVAGTDERAVLDQVIDETLAVISVANLRQSYVFEISTISEDPFKAAGLANTLVSLYIDDQLEAKFGATEKATEWLTGRVEQLRLALENAETKVKQFNSETDLISAESLAADNRQIKEMRDRLADARKTLAQVTAKTNLMEEARQSNDIDAMIGFAEDRSLERLAEVEPGGQKKSTPAFDARYQQLVARAEVDRARLEGQIATLTTSIKEQEDLIQRRSADLVALQQLQREAEASRLIYEYFLSRLKETSVQQGIQQADSRVLSNAVVPLKPSEPRKPLILLFSAFLGFITGATLVLAREFSQNTFRAPEDLEARTHHTVLGQIPEIPSKNRKDLLKYLNAKPTSPAAEAIRNLRTSILLSNIDNPPQVILSTSSIPGEGKTTQSLSLAHNLSGLGKKVLLIEGDIRKRVFSEYFDISPRHGLLAVLSGEAEFDDVVAFQKDLNADVLIGEKSTTNAADIFSSERFTAFLKEMRTRYDFIIIDTPPVLAVPDALIIAQSVDCVIYTVKWDSTSRRQVVEGLKSFERVNAKVTGLVLGHINQRGMKRYGYGDGYGNYGSYYDA